MCLSLFHCLGAIEYNFRSLGWARSAQGINAWLQVNKRNSQCGNLTTTNTSWEERGKRRRRKEGSRPLHEKNLFTLIRLRSFFPVYYTIGTMNTERQRLNGCRSSHTSTYRDSSVLLLQYPNGHDKNPAKKSCDYGLKTLVICPPHSLASYSVLKVSQASLFKQLGIQRIQSWEISNDIINDYYHPTVSLYPNYIVCLPSFLLCYSKFSEYQIRCHWMVHFGYLNEVRKILDGA